MIESVKKRKEFFIQIVLPLILEENKNIKLDRKRLFSIINKSNNVTKSLNKNITFPNKSEKNVDLLNIVEFDMTGTIKIDESLVTELEIPDECIIVNEENEEDGKDPHPNLKSIVKEFINKELCFN